MTGVATPRQPGQFGGGGDFVSFPFYGPWGNWYPWYSPGFGWYAGYVGYNPWNYGATCWNWGIYGPWYDPYGYCWGAYSAPFYVGVSIGGEGGGGEAKASHKTTGDVRILATPKTAKVYIDNALVGTVDEFDGLNDHLRNRERAPRARHQGRRVSSRTRRKSSSNPAARRPCESR